jgi:DNA ligase-1
MTHQLIKEIASNASKLHKESVIRREAVAGNLDFMTGLKLTYNPLITFGVKKVPVHHGKSGIGLPFSSFQKLADDLSSRRLSGHAALDAIDSYMARSTQEEWDGWYRLILTRDLRAGFSESTINKAVKDVNKDFVVPTTPYMRCSLPESSNIDKITTEEWALGLFSQVKYDGMFASVNVREDGFVWITSRAGSLFPEGMLGIEESVARTFKKGTQNHGELTVYLDDVLLERQIGNGILNSVLKGGKLEANQKVHFDCWDQIPLDLAVPKGRYETHYEDRFENVCVQTAYLGPTQVHPAEFKMVYSMVEAQAHYKSVRKRKLEGTILKRRMLPWRDGDSKDQIKFKETIDVELKVIGFEPGKGKNEKTFGSLICQSEDGLLECGVSGISDKLRQEISDNRDDWTNAIVTVTINGVLYSTKVGKLHSAFLPRLVERRNDKTVADTFAQIEAQANAALEE